MPLEEAVAIAFFCLWTVLVVGLFYAYFVMRNRERDTRLPEEDARAPKLEVFASGRVNKRQWTRWRGCRISVYETFLVVSASSQRLLLPLRHIRNAAFDEAHRLLTFEGLTEDETLVRMAFKGKPARDVFEIIAPGNAPARTREAPA